MFAAVLIQQLFSTPLLKARWRVKPFNSLDESYLEKKELVLNGDFWNKLSSLWDMSAVEWPLWEIPRGYLSVKTLWS